MYVDTRCLLLSSLGTCGQSWFDSIPEQNPDFFVYKLHHDLLLELLAVSLSIASRQYFRLTDFNQYGPNTIHSFSSNTGETGEFFFFLNERADHEICINLETLYTRK